MTAARRRAAPWLAVAVVALVAGCASVLRPPVALDGAWPSEPLTADDFKKIDRQLTRHAILRAGFQQVLDVHATLRTPRWRAAWAEREIAVRALPEADAVGLRAEARAAAEGDYEVTLVVVAYERAENDLDHGERSIWRLSLIDDAGVETAASDIVRDRRPRDVLSTELATYGDFAEVYVARFPRNAAALRPGAREVSLKIAGTRGRVVLTWKASAE